MVTYLIQQYLDKSDLLHTSSLFNQFLETFDILFLFFVGINNHSIQVQKEHSFCTYLMKLRDTTFNPVRSKKVDFVRAIEILWNVLYAINKMAHKRRLTPYFFLETGVTSEQFKKRAIKVEKGYKRSLRTSFDNPHSGTSKSSWTFTFFSWRYECVYNIQ